MPLTGNARQRDGAKLLSLLMDAPRVERLTAERASSHPNYTKKEMQFTSQPRSDVAILGAGVIGLSLALELRLRGHSVLVLDGERPLAQASTAAAGMLAVNDPHNPSALLPLSEFSALLYADFLQKIEELSGLPVPFQTNATLQTLPGGAVQRLSEHSIDPRQLAPALLKAAENAGVRLERYMPVGPSGPLPDVVNAAGAIVYTTGAWGGQGLPVTPRKGQMLRVRIPANLVLQEVHRSEHVYVVPRTKGPQAGTALIGATVEDAGFDTSTTPAALASLRHMCAALVPSFADETEASTVEAWAGLRPTTADGLPILGRWHRDVNRRMEHPQSRAVPSKNEALAVRDGDATMPRYVATGHFRNGILLAPATAVLMADLLEGLPPRFDLQPFSTGRPSLVPTPSPGPDDIRPLRRDNRFGNL